VKRDPLFTLLFLVAAAATIAPLWVGRYVPLLDYPNHLSMVFVWFHLDDPAWSFGPHYQLNRVPLPIWGHYLLVYLLSYIFGPELANKIAVSAYLLALPAATALLARRFGRDPRLALFAFPLAWNFSVAQGFLNYVASLPILFVALWAYDRHAESPSLRRALVALALGAIAYTFHVLAWLQLLVFAGVAWLFHAASQKKWRERALASAPLVGIALVAFVGRALAAPFGSQGGVTTPELSKIRGVFNTPLEVLASLPEWILNMGPGQLDELGLILLAFAWIALASLRPAAAQHDERRSFRVEAIALAAFALLFLLPRSLTEPFYWYAVSRRVGVVFALFVVLSLRGAVEGARRWILVAVGVVAVLVPLDIASRFVAFNRDARENYEPLIAQVPQGKRVLPLIFQDGAPEVNVRAYAQWGSWVQMRQGGYVPWALDTQVPIRATAELPAPAWDWPQSFRFDVHAEPWDYFLLRGGDGEALFQDRPAKLMERRGKCELWKKL
jgi:hypothetical protein